MNDFKSRLDSLQPYNTSQEKDAVIYSMSQHNIMELCKKLGGNPINSLEAESFIYKLREKSVGDYIEVTSSCVSCNQHDVFYLNIAEMFNFEELDNTIPIGLFESTSELPDEENINNMNLDDFSQLEKSIEFNNAKIFNPCIIKKCKKCNENMIIKVPYKDIISKFSIKNIFEQYVDISTFTNMTKKDTDSMLPYEREIFLGLIQSKEDDKKNKK